MKAFGLKILPVLSICMFILIMTTGTFLKAPLIGDDDVIHYVNNVKGYIKEDNWDKASTELRRGQEAWKKVVKRIQFSSERNEINSLMINLKRAQGYIKAKNKGGALAEISEVEFIWSELGN